MALLATQPLTVMNTRNLPGGKETSKKAGGKQILQTFKDYTVCKTSQWCITIRWWCRLLCQH
jgi:hypothetical protein